jgi:signal transduction histidine kinase
VSDTGIGISLENQKKISNPFSQADMSVLRAKPQNSTGKND